MLRFSKRFVKSFRGLQFSFLLFQLNKFLSLATNLFKSKGFHNLTLREKCPNTDFFLVRIFLYSVRIQEKTDQKETPYLDSFHAVSETSFIFFSFVHTNSHTMLFRFSRKEAFWLMHNILFSSFQFFKW